MRAGHWGAMQPTPAGAAQPAAAIAPAGPSGPHGLPPPGAGRGLRAGAPADRHRGPPPDGMASQYCGVPINPDPALPCSSSSYLAWPATPPCARPVALCSRSPPGAAVMRPNVRATATSRTWRPLLTEHPASWLLCGAPMATSWLHGVAAPGARSGARRRLLAQPSDRGVRRLREGAIGCSSGAARRRVLRANVAGLPRLARPRRAGFHHLDFVWPSAPGAGAAETAPSWRAPDAPAPAGCVARCWCCAVTPTSSRRRMLARDRRAGAGAEW